MNTTCDVSVVLVNYNGKKYIDVVLDALLRLRHSDFSYEIVFVDNASTDDSVSYLKQKYASRAENLVVVESEENLGFAGGNNLGVSEAHGRYIALLNNDTRPEEDWLEKLYHFVRDNDDVVMANSKLVFFYDFVRLRFYTQDKLILDRTVSINGTTYRIDSKFCKNALCEPEQIVCFGHTEICLPLLDGYAAHCFSFRPLRCAESDKMIIGERELPMREEEELTFELEEAETAELKFTLIQNAGSGINENLDGYDIGFCEEDGEKFNASYEINNGCGAAILFRKEDFDKSGGLDKRFFMYYEDTDLSCRMKRKGGRIMYSPDSVVRHIHAGSSGEWSPFFTYHVCKNKLLFVAKNYGKRRFLKMFFGQLRSGLKEKNRSKLKGTLVALWMVFIGMLAGIFGGDGNKKYEHRRKVSVLGGGDEVQQRTAVGAEEHRKRPGGD